MKTKRLSAVKRLAQKVDGLVLGRGALCLVAVLAIAGTFEAHAAGTAAGTQIPNLAILTYAVNGQIAPPATAIAPLIVVAELINVVLTRQDASLVAVSSPETGPVLSFLLTNTGNASHTFSLARNNALTGDQFDPVSTAGTTIYLESGAQPGFQASGPNADIPYLFGQNDPLLAANATRMVYASSNIPSALSAGAVGNVSLTATSTVAGAAGSLPGASFTGPGPSGMLQVVGASRGQAAAISGYVVSGLIATLVKTIFRVRDPAGGQLVMPGSELTYQIVLTLSGTGVAQNLLLSDPLPVATTYVPGSLSVDGTARTDAADADNASYAAGVISIAFGNTATPATRVIIFKTIVN